MSNPKLLSSLARKVLQQYACLRHIGTSRCTTTDWVPKEVETHTGQKWDDNDYRLARFVNRPKHVNNQFAIELIADVPPKASTERVVSCDGGGGPTGHPKVYINLDKPGNHSCGYCGLRFYLDHSH